uniref:Uncharacterized protein n=1 Tax=Arundo donax TaxID=35708 RepID=A0A0A9GA91_ARUDO
MGHSSRSPLPPPASSAPG